MLDNLVFSLIYCNKKTESISSWFSNVMFCGLPSGIRLNWKWCSCCVMYFLLSCIDKNRDF